MEVVRRRRGRRKRKRLVCGDLTLNIKISSFLLKCRINPRRTERMKRATWQPSSRLIGQRQEKQKARKHVANLLRVRSSVDMSAPKSMANTKGKGAKKKQKMQERKKEIDKENNRLIRKILELDPGQRMHRYRMFNGDSGDRARSMRLASMVRRRKEKERINLQNREMLRRITTCQPTFTKKAWEVQEERREKLKFQIQQNSMNFTPRGTPSSRTPRLGGGKAKKNKNKKMKHKKNRRPKSANPITTTRMASSRSASASARKRPNSANSNSNSNSRSKSKSNLKLKDSFLGRDDWQS